MSVSAGKIKPRKRELLTTVRKAVKIKRQRLHNVPVLLGKRLSVYITSW